MNHGGHTDFMDKHLEFGSRSLAPAGSGEIVEFPRVCAMFDKPYLSRYVRGADGLFHFSECVKLSDTARGQGSATAQAVSLKWENISPDSKPGRCPWCGAAGYSIGNRHYGCVSCGACSTDVCCGRITMKDGKPYFRCRASCGSEGHLGPERESTEGWSVENATQNNRPMLPGAEKRPALPSGKTRAALPGADRPRLKS